MRAGLARAATRGRDTPFWLWLNVLSLDAPLVALVWQDFLARCYPPVMPAPAARFALFLSVWAIYIADRLIDVRAPAAENETMRHRFYRQNGAFARTLLGVVALAGVVASVLWLPSIVLKNGLVTGAMVVCYMAIFPFRRLGMEWKQPCAAMVFTIGVFLVAGSETADAWRILAVPALAFGALCLGNMVLTERWEHGGASAWVRPCLVILAFVCAAAGHSRWYSVVAANAAALAAVDYYRGAVPRDARGVLADLVLLTPLLLR